MWPFTALRKALLGHPRASNTPCEDVELLSDPDTVPRAIDNALRSFDDQLRQLQHEWSLAKGELDATYTKVHRELGHVMRERKTGIEDTHGNPDIPRTTKGTPRQRSRRST